MRVFPTCYQFSRFVGDCIDSVVSQDFDDYECVIPNGGLTEGTADICGSYAGRLGYWHNCLNSGVADAFNWGVQRQP